MALRDISVGTDLNSYINEYRIGLIRNNEIGFSYFNLLLRKLGVGIQLYIAIISAIVILSISILYYKYSKNILLSYYLFVTIGFFSMSMSGLRQTLAICLTIFAFIFLIKYKKILFFFFVVIASFFHNTAIVFLIAYFLRKVKVDKKRGLTILVLSILITLLFKKWIIYFITSISPSKYNIYLDDIGYKGINPIVVVVSILIPLACLFFWPTVNNHNDNEYNRTMSIFLLFSIINVIVNILALDIKLFERLTYYFMVYNTILIPNVIQNMKDKKIRVIAVFLCIVLPLIQFTLATPGGSLGIDNYKFFWE